MVFLKNICEIPYRMKIFEKTSKYGILQKIYTGFMEQKNPRVILMLAQTELQCTYSAGLFRDCLQSAVPGLQGHCVTLQCQFSASRHCAKRTLQCLFRQNGSHGTAKCSAALQWHCKLWCHCSAALQGHCSATCSAS